MAQTVQLLGDQGTVLYDLSAYVQVAEDAGLDPAPVFEDPAFNDAPLAEGQPLVNVDERNREMVFPLALGKAASKDALHATLSQLAEACGQARTLAWKDDGATRTSYFDVTYARLETRYRYFQARGLWSLGVVRVYCAPPFAHTGTMRMVASGVSLHPSGYFTANAHATLPAGSVVGDVPAVLQTQFLVGGDGTVMGAGRVLGMAAVPTGYRSWIPAASMFDVNAQATLAGASGAPGSQAIGPATTALASAPLLARFALSASPHAGRQRVLGVVAPNRAMPLNLSARSENGQPLGATAQTQGLAGFQVVDLGVANVPTFTATSVYGIGAGHDRVSGVDSALTLGAGVNGVLGRVAGVLVLPEDNLRLAVDPCTPIQGRWLTASPGVTALVKDTSDDYGNPYSAAANDVTALTPTGAYSASVGAGAACKLPYQPANIRRRALVTLHTMAGKSAGVGVADDALSYTLSAQFSVTAGGSVYFSIGGAGQTLGATVGLAVAPTMMEISVVRQGNSAYANLRGIGTSSVRINPGGGATSVPVASVGFVSEAVRGLDAAYAYDYLTGSGAVFGHWTDEIGPFTAPGDLYVLDGDGPSYRTGGIATGVPSIVLALDDRLRGGPLTLDPNAAAVAAFLAPRDGGPLNVSLGVLIAVKERFRYAR